VLALFIVRDIWHLDGLYRRHCFWHCWLSSHHQETGILRPRACKLPSNVYSTACTSQYYTIFKIYTCFESYILRYIFKLRRTTPPYCTICQCEFS
jgi:hypothetical protein